MQSDLQLSIVIPALDEESAIAAVIADHVAIAAELVSHFEIVVCDDGSTDRTWDVLGRATSATPELRLIRHHQNRGVAATMKELYDAARGAWTYFTPGDGQVPAEALRRMWAARDGASAVVGRRHPRQDPAVRSVMARAYSMLVRGVFGLAVRDVDGVKLYRTGDARAHRPRSTSTFFEAELLVRLARSGLVVREIDVPHRARLGGRPKAVTPKSTTVALRDAFAFALLPGPAAPAPAPDQERAGTNS